jgi:hypothetical protein
VNRRRRTFRAEGPGFLWMSQDNVLNAMNGSGASRDFGRKNGRWRTEDQQAAKHKCLVSGRFLSLTRITGHASTADEGCCPQMHQNPCSDPSAAMRDSPLMDNATVRLGSALPCRRPGPDGGSRLHSRPPNSAGPLSNSIADVGATPLGIRGRPQPVGHERLISAPPPQRRKRTHCEPDVGRMQARRVLRRSRSKI